MKRLNDRAFNLLRTEIRRCIGTNGIGQVQSELALRRLQRFCEQSGSPVTEAELKDAIVDLIPNFDAKVFRKAAKLNRPVSKVWMRLKFGTMTLALGAGGIWLVNRPIPWVRYPVANTTPFLLTPSYMAMDHDYRSALTFVEQADQLINNSTAFEDLAFGTHKVKAAQKHLDQLPAWFLGHYPGDYCSWATCSWRFTVDEFRSARQEVARMDAKLFQEKNAQTRFEQAEQRLAAAIQKIDRGVSGDDRAKVLAEWRSAIDILEQLPKTTLAGRLAQSKLTALERDFSAIVGAKSD